MTRKRKGKKLVPLFEVEYLIFGVKKKLSSSSFEIFHFNFFNSTPIFHLIHECSLI